MFCKLIHPIAKDRLRGPPANALVRRVIHATPSSSTSSVVLESRPWSRVCQTSLIDRPTSLSDRPTDPWSTVDDTALDASHVARARDGRRQSLRRGRRRVRFHRRCVLHRLRSDSTSKSEGDARRFGGMMMTMTTMSMMSLVRARDRGSRTNAFEVTRRRRRRVRRERRRRMGVMTKETEAR